MSKYPVLEKSFINPSLLSADFANLKRDMDKCARAGCKWVHLDVMDGHFVPNITIGPPVVKSLRAAAGDLFLDTHLMISEPLRYARDFVEAGADLITIHQEAVEDLDRAIRALRRLKTKIGVCLKPKTPVETIIPFLSRLDLVLIMSVEPGFGGQKMIVPMLNKIRQLALIKQQERHKFLIEIDGGINVDTIALAAASGVEVIVAGSAVFQDGQVKENLGALRKAMGHTRQA